MDSVGRLERLGNRRVNFGRVKQHTRASRFESCDRSKNGLSAFRFIATDW